MLLTLLLTQGTAGPATHATSGALTGPGSSVAGSATNFRAFATTGALTGQLGSVAGSASNFTPHATTGALTGQLGAVVGSAARSAGPVTHGTSGTLAGTTSALAGAATRFRAHGSSGTLAGPGALVAGTARRFRAESTSGVLVAPGAILVGSASRTGAATTHDTTGDLFGPGSIIVGEADPIHPAPFERGDGVGRRWKKSELRERDRKLEQERLEKNQLRKLIEQAIDPVKDEESVKIVRTETAVAVVPRNGPAIAIQAPIKFDTKAIAAEVTRALKAIGVEAQRARDAESKRIAAEAFRAAAENVRTRVKRRRDDEFLLLM